MAYWVFIKIFQCFCKFKPSPGISFNFFLRDECPNGKLTRAQLRDLVKTLYPQGLAFLCFIHFDVKFLAGNAENFVNNILRIFDTDGNDFLSFKEFLQAMDIANCSTGEF